MDALGNNGQNQGVRRRILWGLLTVLSAIYVVAVGWGLAGGVDLDVAVFVYAILFVPAMVIGGAVLAWRRPESRAGELLLWATITMFLIPTAVEVPTVVEFQRVGPQDWMWAPMWLNMTLSQVGFVLLMTLLVLLPDGRFRYRRERRFLLPSWLVVVFPTLSVISNEYVITHSQAFPGVENVPSPVVVDALAPYGEAFASLVSLSYVLFLGAIVLLIMRYREAPSRERKQVRWVLYGGTTAIVLGIVPYVLAEIGVIAPITHGALASMVSLVPMLLFPASIIVAVFEPPWVDVDIVIRKSFVYGALSFLILLVYIGVAAAFGVAAGARLDIKVAVLLTVVVAVLFQPARRRLQVVADRWVFGARPTRYEAVKEFGETIEQASDPTELLPRLVDTIQKAIRVQWVSAALDDGTQAESGKVPGQPVLSVPVGVGTEEIGVIRCGPKMSGSIDDDEKHLVQTLAAQVGMAVMNARLAGRIVNAAEAERRRIERNIHDGAQQELVALVARLGMAKSNAARGSLTPEALDDLQREARHILSDLRDLAQGIHPSVLSDGGILEAVEERCTHLPIEVSLRAPESLRTQRFDDDIEGAAYFFVSEALANTLKHAGASKVEVTLSRNGKVLQLGVTDDGRGFDPDTASQNGLTGLSDRIRALGGTLTISSSANAGTSVQAVLPATGP
jgi:signal transduction histidine kinase